MTNLDAISEACDLLIKEDIMLAEDKKPLIKWFDQFEKALKKMGVNYSRSKISPTDAMELYYDKVSPVDAAKRLKGGKKNEAMSDAELKAKGIEDPLKDKGYPYQQKDKMDEKEEAMMYAHKGTHYFKGGKPYDGPVHKMPNGEVHTGKTHNKDSKQVFHSKKDAMKESNALHNGSENSINEQGRTKMSGFKGDSIVKKKFEGLYNAAASVMKNTMEQKTVLDESVLPYIEEAMKSIYSMKAMTPKDRKKIAMEYMLKAEKEMKIKFSDEMKDAFMKNLGVSM